MTNSIRQRIERAVRVYGGPLDAAIASGSDASKPGTLGNDILKLAMAGQMVPRDEHEAAVAEAVERERERAAQIVERMGGCSRCRTELPAAIRDGRET